MAQNIPPCPPWFWNEFSHAGTDYDDLEEIRRYDERMGSFRDIEGEVRAALDYAAPEPDGVLVEIGCGTGDCAIAAGHRCRRVVAVDVSASMLEYAKRKAARAGIHNLEFAHGGFLTYVHEGEPADAVITSIALHHLPDFWKAVALRRVADVLKPGGRLFLRDVVFPFENGFDANLAAVVGGSPEVVRPEFIRHVAQEYSTMDWIMRGLLERAGFSIELAGTTGLSIATYGCRKR